MRRRGKRWTVPAAVVAFFRLPGTRSFVVILGVFAVVAVAAVATLAWRYRAGSEDLSLGEALWAVFNLLFFNTVYPLGDDLATRLVFYAVPLVGIVLLGNILLRVGRAVLDRQAWERAVASTYSDHVIVCGLGRVGFRVVRWLLDLGESVVAVEHDAQNEFLDQVRAWDVPVIVADARRPEVLEQAGVARAASVAPITNDDILNLTIATQARTLRPDIRLVLRTFEDALAANLQKGFDIHAAYSASALAAPAFAAAAARVPVDHAIAVAGSGTSAFLTVTKFTLVPESRLVGYTIDRLERELGVRVLAHRRTGFDVDAPRETVLAAGDGVVVSAPIERLNRLARLTPPTRYLQRYEAGRWPIETASREGPV